MKAKFSVTFILLLLPLFLSASKKHTIKTVAPIAVETPAGTTPRLPYQVWVTYADGTHEWRQVKWSNFDTKTEQQQASEKAGATYKVQGFIVGDNTTSDGFPIEASITVTADKTWAAPASKPKAEPLPLTAVSLKGKNRLTNNRDLDIQTLLNLDVTQQLYNYRDTYGLPTEGYTVSDGWDSPTTKLKGHGTGHYLSALSFAFASAQNADQKRELYFRIERMVNEMRQCQELTFVWSDSLGRYFEARDYAPEAVLKEMKGNWKAFNEYKKDYKHYGYGYLNAIPAAHPALIECYRAYNNEEWVWAPYYTIHKQLAGLIDIANVMRSYSQSGMSFAVPQGHMPLYALGEKALLIAKDMGLWVWNRLHYRTYVKTDGTKAERQATPGNRYEMWNMYIAGEVGGMEESLSRLSEMISSPDEKAKLLEAASCFDSPAFFNPVSQNIDDIRTRHANQHIPMITGALRSYRGNGNPYYYNLALNFWNMVQGRYAYAMGGVGNGEMFRQPYSQVLSMNTNVQNDFRRNVMPNPDLNETCCAYNLAKLTKDLNCYDPDDARYMDYYERVLYNQIVGSVNPDHWGVCYQYAVGMNASKPFGSETPQSTCCGGTGVENHVKYQEATYFTSGNTLYVALYLPTEAVWAEKNATIAQECEWPAEQSRITVSGRMALKLRVPYWATEGFDIRVNGKSVSKSYQPSSYVELPEREWTSADVIEVKMPFTKHLFFGPDKMDIAATGRNESRTPFDPQWVGTLMYGPLVMATPDIKEWKDAEFTLKADLSDIKTAKSTISESTDDATLYTLSLAGKQFVPDYYFHEGHATHYLRLNVLTGNQTQANSKQSTIASLERVLAVAQQRQKDQEAWDALTVKVPEHAPWAPNGYARLLSEMKNANILLIDSKRATPEQLQSALSALNVAINTMRPGNLAEPEDLSELLPLVTRAKDIANKTTELREAISYADMVISYVNDGSGTKDLIQKALARLRELVK